MFELTDPSGLDAGQLEVSLQWTFEYVPPEDADSSAEELGPAPKDQQPDAGAEQDRRTRDSTTEAASQKNVQQGAPGQEELLPKKVTFVDASADEKQVSGFDPRDSLEDTVEDLGSVSPGPVWSQLSSGRGRVSGL